MAMINDPKALAIYRDFNARVSAAQTQRVEGRRPQIRPQGLVNSSYVSADDRDILIRTVIGEANGESMTGQAAVAHNVLNRTRDSRYPDRIKDVALQKDQYSTWRDPNAPTGDALIGGNSLATRYNPGDRQYDRAAEVVDLVLSGEVPDMTNGAVNYYAPKGMRNGMAPRWWASKLAESGGEFITIGGHRFAGKSNNLGAQVFDTSGLGYEVNLDEKPVGDVYADPDKFRLDTSIRLSNEASVNLGNARNTNRNSSDTPSTDYDPDYSDLIAQLQNNSREPLQRNELFHSMVKEQHNQLDREISQKLSE